MTQHTNALPVGTVLEEYQIESVLGTGGFGITYKAWDGNLESRVAIKEYFPSEWSYRDHDHLTVRANTQGLQSVADPNLSDYEWGLDRFLDEARVLARVKSPYVVRINRYFRANGSAYIVMDYEDGEPLSAVLRRRTTLDEAELYDMLGQILPALQAVHEQGYLHRDIKPGNLYVRADGPVILIDFGAARQSLGRQSKSVTGLVTPGYSPPEQYALRSDRYGTWTDIYALGAVLYRCISGKAPVESAERLIEDSMLPALEVGLGRYSPQLLKVIDKALAVRPEHRYQNVEEMRTDLGLMHTEAAEAAEARAVSAIPPVAGGDTPTRLSGKPDQARPVVTRKSPSRAVLGGGALLTVAVLALAGWWWLSAGREDGTAVVGESAVAVDEALTPDPPPRAIDPTVAIRGFWQHLGRHNQQSATDQTFWLDIVALGARTAGEAEEAAESDPEQQIQQLLAQATQRLNNNQLTIPAGNNALYFYEQVLALDPDNRQALQGRARIVDRYVALASQELSSADYAGARRFVRRGLNITPNHPRLLALAERLDRGPARRSSVRIRQPYPERRTVSPAELFNWDSR